MWQVILQNITYVSIAFGIFFICVIANIIASVFYNTNNLKQVFDVKRLFTGFIKMISVGITTAILAIVASLLPIVIQIFSIDIPDNVENTYTVIAIGLLYFNAIRKYFTEAFNTIKEILENKEMIE
jgi:hypothetical protein